MPHKSLARCRSQPHQVVGLFALIFAGAFWQERRDAFRRSRLPHSIPVSQYERRVEPLSVCSKTLLPPALFSTPDEIAVAPFTVKRNGA